MDDLEEFCNVVLDNKPDDAYVLVWTLPGKISYWCKTIEDVIAQVRSLPDTTDVYIGCGWAAKPLGRSKRAKAHEIIGIPGNWADVDIQWDGDNADSHKPGKVHKDASRPASVEEALAFIRIIAPEPTIIVNSGHGIHAWWIYKEAWIFENEDERKVAQAYCAAWQDYLHAHFASKGWTLDAVGDLPRVLRFPGTFNNKNEPIRTYLHKG